MALKVANLSKRYKDTWVLRDVSFDVNDGEIFGIFGASGSGKTTLLNVVRGVEGSNGGTILTGDQDALTAGAGRRSASSFPLESRPSIWRRLFGKRPDASFRADSLKQFFNGADGLLVLDDPFLGLDDSDFEPCADEVRDLVRARGLSVIIASNNFDRLLGSCDRVGVLAGGTIRQIGTPQEIYERPESRAVAAMIGRNNLFRARRLTSSKAEVPEFHTIDGGHRLFAQRTGSGALGALNQNVTLAIRPEHISISFGASFPEDNLLKATVEKIQFLGPTTLISLDAGDLKLKAQVLRVVGLNVGDECMVGLPPDRIQIFKD